MSDASTVIASTGVALLLLAYVLRSWGRLPDDRAYAAMNLVGAGLSAYASYLVDFVPFVVLEGAWSLAAATQLVTLINLAAASPTSCHHGGPASTRSAPAGSTPFNAPFWDISRTWKRRLSS